MTNRLTTAPTEEPISLAEMRLQIGITGNDDTARDAVISSRITSARQWAEKHTQRAFVTQTWTYYASVFTDYFDLKLDLQSVTSVKYIDSDGVLKTLDSSSYKVDLVNSRVYLAYGESWPTVRNEVNAIQVEHISGYGLAETVPEQIKEAIKFTVGHWENYQSTIEGAERITTIPYAVTQLLAPYVDLRSVF